MLGAKKVASTKEHLPYYLDEFTFRFNRRTSKARGMLFYRLVEQAVLADHVSTRQLSKNTGLGLRQPAGGVK
jgi:hypothetical protein